MIKVVNLVSVIIAPIIVQYRTLGVVGWVIVVLLLGALAWAVWQSKRQAPPIQVSDIGG
jgi:K(+)-stimulated pyrophosphate-energized sodium pump